MSIQADCGEDPVNGVETSLLNPHLHGGTVLRLLLIKQSENYRNEGRTMMNLRKLTCFAIVVAVPCLVSTAAFAASLHNKPQPPLAISIAPAQPGATLETIKAGDVVDLKVTATSMIDTTELRIKVKLEDGAELVSGELSWAGPAGKREEKQLLFSVRVPAEGTGKIRAELTVSTDGGRPLQRSARYLLLTEEQKQEQMEAKKNMKAAHPAKKDSKGRPIVEY